MVAFIMHAPGAGEAAQRAAAELAGVPTATLEYGAKTAHTRFGADVIAVLLWTDELSTDLEGLRTLGAQFGHRLIIAARAAARDALESLGLANRVVETGGAGVLGARAAALISRQWALLRRAQTTVAGVRPRAALALERLSPAARRDSTASRMAKAAAAGARPAEGGRAASMAMRSALGVATTVVIAGAAAPMIIARAAQPENAPAAPDPGASHIYEPLAISAPTAIDAADAAPESDFTAAEAAVLRRVADLPPMPPAISYTPPAARAPAAAPVRVAAAPAPVAISFANAGFDAAPLPAIAPLAQSVAVAEPQAAPLVASAEPAKASIANGTAAITTVAALQRFAVAARAIGPDIAERVPMVAAEDSELSTRFVSWAGESE